MIAATIEKQRDADDRQDRDEGLQSAASLREEASPPRAFKRTARPKGKPKKWAAAKIREDFRRRAGVFEARSTPGIEFVDHDLGIAVIFGARHDAVIQTLRTCLMRVMLRA